jgi:putative ubiquitin-RnfH superfamily antitoxin RatB of RatAB toxin-antitoxin module
MAADPEPGVEVVYALPDRQRVITLPWQPGSSARDAVEASGLASEFPEIRDRPLELGIFGRRIDETQLLEAGDRVEIYRPLPDDPRERRRRRAAESAAAARRKPR